jgi:hypothetical protein
MSKKMMLLALAAVSAAMFALPAAASAQEAHIEGVTNFSGTFGKSTLTTSGEPTITCESTVGEPNTANHVTGVVNPGGTTGEITLDFTHCHIIILGVTRECKTAGAPLPNTIKSSGVFHVITINNKPGVLVTPVKTAIECQSAFATINVAGNVIGTITSPACGVESKNLVTKFTSAAQTQEHKTYTGTSYNLTAQTGSGEVKEAGLNAEATLVSATAGKINCT